MAKKEPGSAAMLVLALLKSREMYGYEIIEELARRSNNVFQYKEGTLYPLLHTLERERLVTAREAAARRGLRELEERRAEWSAYSAAVTAILAGA